MLLLEQWKKNTKVMMLKYTPDQHAFYFNTPGTQLSLKKSIR
jgi:hypothetical protein